MTALFASWTALAERSGDSAFVFLSIDRKDVAIGGEDFWFLASDADHQPFVKAQV
ncbi:MAG: hypothetical protein WCS94_18190 [Verrucomicrobiota bacterium]